MGRPTRRQFTPEQKLEVVLRLWRGEQLTQLAREQGVDHTTIYRWRDQVRAGSLDSLAGKREDAPAQARAEIRELQRMLGKKTQELEILGEALRRLG